jgi:hypothetical protein
MRRIGNLETMVLTGERIRLILELPRILPPFHSRGLE